jgi:ribosomal protein S18 acetylase RimI-like enzyme
VGFVSGGKTRQPDLPFDAELYALYVKPSHQRRLVGRRLTWALANDLIERGFRGLVVGVLQANESGRRFYESIGGAQVGSQTRMIGSDSHAEVFYGWPAIRAVSSLTTG